MDDDQCCNCRYWEGCSGDDEAYCNETDQFKYYDDICDEYLEW